MSAAERNASRTPRARRRASISTFAAFRPAKRNSPPGTLILVIGCRLTLVAGLVHHAHGLIDRHEAARKARVQHLRERVLAFTRHHVARLTDEVLLTFLALHQLGEVCRVRAGETLH